jgi:hypothetical protein
VTKPYFYRGTGVDTLTPNLGEDWERGKGEPEPATTTTKRIKSKPQPRRRRRKPRNRYWREPGPPQYRLGDRRHPEHHLYYKSDPQPLGPEPEPEPIPTRPTKPVRPAPGWEPTKGVDIDAWLEEYEVD